MYDLKRMNFVTESAEAFVAGIYPAIMGAFLWDMAPEGTEYWVEEWHRIGDTGEPSIEAIDKVKDMIQQSIEENYENTFV
jgi:hypothetical protein